MKKSPSESTGASLRILQAISSPGVGGREIDVPVLTRQLVRLGYPTWMLCRPGTLVEKLGRDWQLQVVPTRMKGYCDPGPVWELARFLRRERIQMIHAHWSRDLANLIAAAGLAGGIPIVLTKHVYATESKRDLFHDWVYRRVRAVIAISRLVEDNVARTTATPKAKIYTIYNGIDTKQEWDPDRMVGQDLRPDFGVPTGAPILGYAGRLNRGKSPHLLLEAFAGLAGRYPDWHLVLVGRAVGAQEEAYAAALRTSARERGLSDRVHFAGYRHDMPAVMRTFDVAVCPSEFESLGMVVVEAMAMERPVVGSNSGGIPEIIEAGVNGELFQPGDAGDLAAKLEPFLAEPELRARRGAAGRKRVLEQFSLEGMAESVVKLFETILQPQAR